MARPKRPLLEQDWAFRFGARLRAARYLRGLTITRCAAELGVTTHTWGVWERAESVPSAVFVAFICRLLRVTADSLLLDDHWPDCSGIIAVAGQACSPEVARDADSSTG